MKHPTSRSLLAVCLLFSFGVGSTVRAAPSKHTANYVRGHGDTLARTKVSIDVGFLQPLRFANTEDVSFFTAFTWDEREKLFGGIITVAVDATAAEKFVSKFGSSPDVEQRGWVPDFNTRRLTGYLREGKEGRFFIDTTTYAVDAAIVPAGNPIAEAIAEIIRKVIEKQQENQNQ